MSTYHIAISYSWQSKKFNQHILNFSTEADQGFYFKVELHYPSDIHHKTADFSLVSEAAQVTQDMWLPYM